LNSCYKFLGHVVRKSQLESLLITGKVDGKKGPGSQNQLSH